MDKNKVAKLCMKHWKMLKDETESQGLGLLISKDSKELAERLKNKDHDPLMGACMAITMQFMTDCLKAGLKPEGCPICGAITSGVAEMNWIIGAVKDQKDLINKEMQ